MLKLTVLFAAVALSSAGWWPWPIAPYSDWRSFFLGVHEGYVGQSDAEMYQKCLTDQTQAIIKKDWNKIWTDYDADKSISTVFDDVWTLVDVWFTQWSGCKIGEIPGRFLDTLVWEGPFFLIRVLINLEAIIDDLDTAATYFDKGSIEDGAKYIGKAIAEFIPPPKPSQLEGSVDNLKINPLDLIDGLITGL
jgi:hypothetical protein